MWSTIVELECKVRLKLKDEIAMAIVDELYSISKLSFDCYATTKVDINLPSSGLTREYQLCDLIN